MSTKHGWQTVIPCPCDTENLRTSTTACLCICIHFVLSYMISWNRVIKGWSCTFGINCNVYEIDTKESNLSYKMTFLWLNGPRRPMAGTALHFFTLKAPDGFSVRLLKCVHPRWVWVGFENSSNVGKRLRGGMDVRGSSWSSGRVIRRFYRIIWGSERLSLSHFEAI